jgi:hypothetical protein
MCSGSNPPDTATTTGFFIAPVYDVPRVTIFNMNTSRGFASLVLILIIVGLVVLGGVGYYTSMGKPDTQLAPVEATSTPVTSQTSENSTTTPTMTVTPISGKAPLIVMFSNIWNGPSDEDLDFGDGEKTSNGAAGQWPITGVTHTYREPGTYVATLYRYLPHIALGTVTVTVTGIADGVTTNAPAQSRYAQVIKLVKEENQLDPAVVLDITNSDQDSQGSGVNVSGWQLRSRVSGFSYKLPSLVYNQYSYKGSSPTAVSEPVIISPLQGPVLIQQGGNQSDNSITSTEITQYHLFIGGKNQVWGDHDVIDLFDSQGLLVSSVTY